MTLEQKTRKLSTYEKIGFGITGLCLAGGLAIATYGITKIVTLPTKSEYVQILREENPNKTFGREIYALAEQREQNDLTDIMRKTHAGMFGLMVPAILIPRMLLMAKYSRQEE